MEFTFQTLPTCSDIEFSTLNAVTYNEEVKVTNTSIAFEQSMVRLESIHS